MLQGGTALFHAAAGGQAGAVHELLEGRADHHVANTQGLTPLHAAMVAKAMACVAMLQVRRPLLTPRHIYTGRGLLCFLVEDRGVELTGTRVSRQNRRLCVALLQEAERMYLLHKIRTLSEDRLKRSQLPTWPLPPYYLPSRAELPLVELSRPEGSLETAAALEWVVKGMDADVFTELAEMLGRDGRSEGGEAVKLVAQGQEEVVKAGTRKRTAVGLNE